MAIFEWVGNAAPVAQSESFEIGTTLDGHTFQLIINNKTVEVSATGTGEEESVVDALVAAWNAVPYPECADAVATKTNNATANPYVITLTAAVPGRPYVIQTGGSGTMTTFGTKVTNEGPNVWGLAGNYQDLSTGNYVLPDDGDEVHIRVNRPSILYNLDDAGMAAKTLSTLRIDNVFTGNVGLPKWNSRGYNEYLPTVLLQPASELNIGRGEGQGSPRLKVNLGNVLCNATIFNSGSSGDVDYAAVQLDNFGNNSVVTIHSGEADFYRESSVTGVGGFSNFRMLGGSARVINPSGTLTMQSLDIETWNNPTLAWDAPLGGTSGTCKIHGGNITFGPVSTVETTGAMTIDGPATVRYAGKNIDSLTIDDRSASIDFTDAAEAITVTSLSFLEGNIITGDAKVTFSSAIPRGTITARYP